MAWFLYHLTLTESFEDTANWSEDDAAMISRHADFLDALGREGRLVFAGRTDFAPGHPDLFGIALIRADSLGEAEELMAPDPAVLAGIQSARVLPFTLPIDDFSG
jgi:uncharacterized protein YciI